MSKIWSATVSEALNGILGVVTRELVYSKVEGQVKASEVHRFQLYVDIVRDRFGGQDAQRALDDLTKEEGAEKKKVLVERISRRTARITTRLVVAPIRFASGYASAFSGGKHPVKDCTKKAPK